LLHGRRIVVVMPAYNAERTLRKTFAEIPRDVVDEVLLTDDASSDATVRVARELGISTFVHDHNRGYGGNQKTCYAAALARDADITVMLHPDYQYTPRLITAMAALIAGDVYDVVLGSRILVGSAIRGGMPRYKYLANRALTLVENLLVGSKLSEFHTGYRAFSRRVLETLPLLEGSDDFVFDNQMLLQALYFRFRVGEISCPALYDADSSSIGFSRSVVYGFGVLGTALSFRLARWGVVAPRLFAADGRRLRVSDPAAVEAAAAG
jgi:glycosyltransferase involved in cell wall biosynthesis